MFMDTDAATGGPARKGKHKIGKEDGNWWGLEKDQNFRFGSWV